MQISKYLYNMPAKHIVLHSNINHFATNTSSDDEPQIDFPLNTIIKHQVLPTTDKQYVMKQLAKINFGIKVVEFASIAILSEILANRLLHTSSAAIGVITPQFKNKYTKNLKPAHKIIIKESLAFTIALGLTRLVMLEAKHYANKKLQQHKEYQENKKNQEIYQ